MHIVRGWPVRPPRNDRANRGAAAVNASLTEAVRESLLASIRAVDPRELTANALRGWNGGDAPHRVRLIAVGKAAIGMAHGAADVLGRDGFVGVVIAPDISDPLPDGIIAFAGGHPLPNADGAAGAQMIARFLSDAGRRTKVLVLISGGASALMTFPPNDLTLDHIVTTSHALMAAGADIRELNCVRKHLDQLKGGLLAKASNGADVRALVLSDVIGDPLDVIGSGPLVPDPTTYADAIAVLKARRVWDGLPRVVSGHLLAGARGDYRETPKEGDPCFANIEIEIIGNNALAVAGAASDAARRGFDVELVHEPIGGEARDAGAWFAGLAIERHATVTVDRRPLCIVGGGETTVTVTGAGVGGRNLELATAAALVIDGIPGIAIGSIGTDGRDGPTDAAGAIVTGESAPCARERGIDLARHLRNNDSLRALDSIDAIIRTGPTGTNVSDVQVAIIGAL